MELAQETIKNPELEREVQTMEKGEEGALRPLSLDEFIGQPDLKANLDVFIKASKARGDSMDHVLLCRVSGDVRSGDCEGRRFGCDPDKS